MKTMTTSMLLSVIFLSAGAFAGGNRDVHSTHSVAARPDNVTVVNKNRVWPPAGLITVNPCNVRRCLDV